MYFFFTNQLVTNRFNYNEQNKNQDELLIVNMNMANSTKHTIQNIDLFLPFGSFIPHMFVYSKHGTEVDFILWTLLVFPLFINGFPLFDITVQSAV